MLFKLLDLKDFSPASVVPFFDATASIKSFKIAIILLNRSSYTLYKINHNIINFFLS
jgi:hypothetical protein